MVRGYGDDYRRDHHPSVHTEAVLRHIADCRTAVLGGHLEECGSCSHRRVSYNSCRDRHCPKCQTSARSQWVTDRMERLLPVPYFHVVFTIPAELNALALGNKERVFDVLFASASKTLATIAADERHLGAQLGFTAVLHTWGQNLSFHPHLHCVVTGGGLSADQTRWISARENYLLPVKVLAALFRGKFLAALHRAWREGQLELGGSVAGLADPGTWRRFKDGLYAKDWVVYAKEPFGGPRQVFTYLGRYTHGIAISNHRITDVSDGKVTFWWKDYADASKKKLMTLEATEFLRRFLLHVLPKGYVRIRHYGLCAPRNVGTKLVTARRLLAEAGAAIVSNPDNEATELGDPKPWWERFLDQTGIDVMACPSCGVGRMVRIRPLSPLEAAELAALLEPAEIDTS